MSKELAEALGCEVDEDVKERYEKLKDEDIHPENYDSWDEALEDYKLKVEDPEENADEALAEYMSKIYGGDVEEYEGDIDTDEQKPDFEGEGAERDELPCEPIPEEED